MTLGDTSINGEYGDMKFTGGSATVELKGGQTATATGLPTDVTYTITEATATGFTVTAKTGDNGTISKTKSTASFTNTRDTGELEVTKTVVSTTASDKTKDFTFTVTLNDTSINKTYSEVEFKNGVGTFTLKDGGTKKIEGLPTGITYKVEEATAAGFVTTKTGDTGDITKSETATAAFTNTKDEGGLIVSKKVVSPIDGDKNREFSFTVKLNDTTVNGKYGDMTFTNGAATFTLKDGQSLSATGLAANIKYTVTEKEEDNFTTTYTGATGTIVKEKTQVAEVTNTHDTGDLKLSKKLVSDAAADKDKVFEFTIELSDKSIAGTIGGVQFEEGKATVTLKGGASTTITGLPTGVKYTITEKDAPGFKVTARTGDTGTISKTISTAEFTNTRETGDLELTKKLVSERAADKDIEFTFTVELSDKTISKKYGDMEFKEGVAEVKLKGGKTATATGLPTGVTYTITEAEAEGFKVTGKTGDAGTISTTKSEAEFTNTRETGELAVSKTLISDRTADKEQTFTFTVKLDDTTINGTYGEMEFKNGTAEVTIKGGETATAKDLPTDIKYTITETEVEGFELTDKVKDTGTISTEKAIAVFTNTRETGILTVKKTVVSDTEEDKTTDFSFIVTLSDTGINGTYGDMEFTKGVAEFTLKHNESKTAEGLPTEVKYTVEEEADDRFVVTSTGETGSIAKDKDAVVEFTNIFIDIKVRKVDDKKEPVKGAVLAVKNEKGEIVDQWTTDGTPHQVENLLPDTKYTVTELKVPAGYEKSLDITFKTDSSGKAQVLEMVDKKTVVPDTSDHNRTPGWTISMIMSLLMAGLAFATRRKYGFKN